MSILGYKVGCALSFGAGRGYLTLVIPVSAPTRPIPGIRVFVVLSVVLCRCACVPRPSPEYSDSSWSFVRAVAPTRHLLNVFVVYCLVLVSQGLAPSTKTPVGRSSEPWSCPTTLVVTSLPPGANKNWP